MFWYLNCLLFNRIIGFGYWLNFEYLFKGAKVTKYSLIHNEDFKLVLGNKYLDGSVTIEKCVLLSVSGNLKV